MDANVFVTFYGIKLKVSWFSRAWFISRQASISSILALSNRRYSPTSSLALRAVSVVRVAPTVMTFILLQNHSSADCRLRCASFSYCTRMSRRAADRSGLATSISTDTSALYWIWVCNSAISLSQRRFRKVSSSSRVSTRFSSSAWPSVASSAPFLASMSLPSASSLPSTSSSYCFCRFLSTSSI
uniref:REJ domain-containing protein n=1 Tax=Astatotilapia calliptera TaxID=8154 RepID=A0AAX7UWY9_ASTCA